MNREKALAALRLKSGQIIQRWVRCGAARPLALSLFLSLSLYLSLSPPPPFPLSLSLLLSQRTGRARGAWS
jgi:hypothetical protein